MNARIKVRHSSPSSSFLLSVSLSLDENITRQLSLSSLLEQLSLHFHPVSLFSLLVPSYPLLPSLFISGAGADRAIVVLESPVGEGGTMKRGVVPPRFDRIGSPALAWSWPFVTVFFSPCFIFFRFVAFFCFLSIFRCSWV